MIQSIHDPYKGVAESGVTSNVIPLRNAWDFSMSATTSAGTASALTIQVNSTGQKESDISSGYWSAFTTFTLSGISEIRPFDENERGAPRWARILRTPSLASHTFSYQLKEK